MANYLVTKYKGVYRILPHLSPETNDFAKNIDGSIDEDNVYIHCQYGNEIYYYGNGILAAYIPSLGRGRNIRKALDKEGVEIFDYDESDDEVTFHFKPQYIEQVTSAMKVRTAGASTNPFDIKNLPRNKDVVIPEDELDRYKSISSKVDKRDRLKFAKWNEDFLINVLQKKIRKETKNRKYDYKEDMKAMLLSTQLKQFIYAKNMWNEYLGYLDNVISEYYNNN